MIIDTYTSDEEVKDSLIKGFNMITYNHGLIDHGFTLYNHRDRIANPSIIEQPVPIGEAPFGIKYPDYRKLNIYDLSASLTDIMFFSNYIFLGKDSASVTFATIDTAKESLISDVLSSGFMACMNEDIGLASAMLQSAYQLLSFYEKPDKQVQSAVYNNSYTIKNKWR